jgi:hypothetical protein
MSLWDAVSGKVYHWNSTKGEAVKRVCKGLKPYVSSRLAEYPNLREELTKARNSLFAYFISASSVISSLVAAENTVEHQHKDRFYSLNADLFLRFIRAFHSHHVTIFYSPPERRSLLYLMSDGIVEMYAPPSGYMEKWLSNVGSIQTDPAKALFTLEGQLYGEIAPILGLPEEENIIDRMHWGSLQRFFTEAQKEIYNRPGWGETVEAELASH